MSTLRLVPAVHRATHRIGLFLEAARPPLGLSQGEAHLLAHLADHGDSSIAQLHGAFAHKRSSLTTYLDRLAEKGLVSRSTHPVDRRSFLIALTKAGATAATRVQERLADLEAAVARRVGPKDLQPFLNVIEAIADEAAARGKP